MDDIRVNELKERMAKGESLHIVDVREDWEHEEANIEGSTLIPLGDLPTRLSELDNLKGEEVIVHCKSGGRSGRAKQYMTGQGFSKVRNLLGGMDEFSQS
ncbi:rhodanese-like domain-containing protein [Microscilla marina]|uniref:Rhodanese domain protein n=1 Tax=Microscilla marina ATCC 23134 TaxID=313606 RepID=A1ZZ10_MICM2|nr:rhodanese-like domain-containing protein [Microscilla marina]EAY24390.1 rhodanese domain protein [Microscilla marina ATCC 23134]